MCAGTHGGQKRALDSLEWEIQIVVSCLMEVLGTELRVFRRAVSALNHQSPLPSVHPPPTLAPHFL